MEPNAKQLHVVSSILQDAYHYALMAQSHDSVRGYSAFERDAGTRDYYFAKAYAKAIDAGIIPACTITKLKLLKLIAEWGAERGINVYRDEIIKDAPEGVTLRKLKILADVPGYK